MHNNNTLRSVLSVAAFAAAFITCCSAQAADIVVVGHPNAAAISKEQAADIYTGKTQSANALDQPESAALRAEFYKKATGKDLVQIKSLWARLAFTGKGQPPKEVADSAAVKKAVAADPKAVGYIEKSAVDASVKVLVSLD
jgi:ABC-type phosphate transport system substrate-binding protein